ncbi:glycosyltransferase family protein [Frigidibacter sp. MR17.24]|uniref:glycosyltransferase family protein n=1 Tax=Frigidibacter sp. MR17.24 TaxID=3127345 RepID=UPI0030131D6E
MTSRPRIMFYVQHLLGMGHVARASRICAALADAGAEVTVVTGGLPLPNFPPAGLDHVALPPVTSANEGFVGLVDAEGRPVTEAFKAERARRLVETFHRLRPDAVVTEAFPFGRRQLRFELIPLIEAIAAARPRPLLVSSVRDILQTQLKPGRVEEMAALARDHFDAVLVHGDPAFVRFEDTFPLHDQIAGKLRYTGLVAPPPVEPAADGRDVVVSAGGGAVGAALSMAAIEAAAELPDLRRWAVITGPNLPAPQAEALRAAAARRAPGQVEIIGFRPDFASLLAASRLSVSQAGYNTACDLLQARVRAVLVPYAAGGETEQAFRAERMAAAGRAAVVTEDALSGPVLAAAIRAALAMPDPAASPLDLRGAQTTAQLLCDLIVSHQGQTA